MKYLKLYEDFNSSIIGYHKTNNTEDILKRGFDTSKIKVAFLGKGFSFAVDPEGLKDYPAKDILKCEIVLNHPLTDENIWNKILLEVDPNNEIRDLLEISTKLSNKLIKMGYDGILAMRSNGWWKNVPNREDEIIVFDTKCIKKIELL